MHQTFVLKYTSFLSELRLCDRGEKKKAHTQKNTNRRSCYYYFRSDLDGSTIGNVFVARAKFLSKRDYCALQVLTDWTSLRKDKSLGTNAFRATCPWYIYNTTKVGGGGGEEERETEQRDRQTDRDRQTETETEREREQIPVTVSNYMNGRYAIPPSHDDCHNTDVTSWWWRAIGRKLYWKCNRVYCVCVPGPWPFNLLFPVVLSFLIGWDVLAPII